MWPNPQETAELITFTEEIFNGKLHFLCSIKEIVLFPCVENLLRKFKNHHIKKTSLIVEGISCFEKWLFVRNVKLNLESLLWTLRKKCPYSELFWSAFFPHFPAFRLTTEWYIVFLRNQSECVKNTDQNNSE